MIEEVLLKSNYVGKDGFQWWLGQIAQPGVWKEQSNITEPGNWGERCKVRIIGYHPFDPNILKDDDLPWAQVMLDPSFGSSHGGIGGTVDLKGGEACFGFFLDGDDAQQPVVVGLLYRSDGVRNLVDYKTIEKEKGSRFKPFTGQPSGVPSTQRDSRKTKTLGDEETSPIPASEKNAIGFNSNVGYFGENSIATSIQIGDKIAGVLRNVPSSSTLAVEKKASKTVIKPNGCQNNLIGQITQALQDFMAVANGLDRYLDTYIDPVLNEFVNVENIIRNTSRQILGIVKLILNNLRGTIFKCLVWGFRKLVTLFVSLPQQTIIMEALKKLLDMVFCILEKLPASIFGFIQDSLSDLFAKTINVPSCAAEQWTAGILAKLMDSMESALSTVMSGINSILDGIGSVSNILNQASSLASHIFSFLECTGLACETPTVWASRFGPSKKESDDWNKMVSNVNVFKGISGELNSIDSALKEIPFFGDNPIFDVCNQKVNNPTSQRDVVPLPPGIVHNRPLPPIIDFVDSGNNGSSGEGFGACALPIVASDGTIFSVKVINGGFGYKSPPTITIIDNTGYGSGAKARSIISAAGTVQSIVVLDPGQGYTQGNYTNIEKLTCSDLDNGIGISTGICSTDSDCPDGYVCINGTCVQTCTGTSDCPEGYMCKDGVCVPMNEQPGISSSVSGCVKSIIVISPGYGYTTGDTISDGKNTYNLVVSPNSGAIIDVISPNNFVCGFTEVPNLVINTSTGVAANLVASMEFVKSYTNNNNNVLTSNRQVVGLGITSVIDCV